MSQLSFRSSLTLDRLLAYTCRQVNTHFPDDSPVVPDEFQAFASITIERLEHCFSHINNRYFFDDNQVVFNHLHSDQYAMWLYLLSNQAYRNKCDPATCSKLFLLNKALHGLDAFYEVELPSVFLLVHPLGTVLGRANYSDFFVAYQRCGIGSNRDRYPTLGQHVTLRPGAAILGNCQIGDHCQIATESLILDRDLPANTLYIGNPGNAVLKPQTEPYPLWRLQDHA
jgi:serine O-acetyltransferase